MDFDGKPVVVSFLALVPAKAGTQVFSETSFPKIKSLDSRIRGKERGLESSTAEHSKQA
jgi:hypothetical protein